jgi:hypothetical protein
MKTSLVMARLFCFLLLASTAVGVVGCATSEESDNVSARPWNSPKGWENGLPSTITEGR